MKVLFCGPQVLCVCGGGGQLNLCIAHNPSVLKENSLTAGSGHTGHATTASKAGASLRAAQGTLPGILCPGRGPGISPPELRSSAGVCPHTLTKQGGSRDACFREVAQTNQFDSKLGMRPLEAHIYIYVKPYANEHHSPGAQPRCLTWEGSP